MAAFGYSRRLGSTAIELERLRQRDRFTIDEAVTSITTQDPSQSEESLRHLADLLPAPPPKRRYVDPSIVARIPDWITPAYHLESDERAERIETVLAAIRKASAALDAQDYQIFTMRFLDDMKARDIARALDLPQKRVYGRIEKIRKAIQARLASQGITQSDVDPVEPR